MFSKQFVVLATIVVIGISSVAVWASKGQSKTQFSAATLIQQYKGEKPYPAPNADVGRALSIEYASGYLSGISDSFEGKEWCNKYSINAGDLKAYLQDYIEKLPESRRSIDAKVVVLEALNKRYPCR